VGPLVAVVVVVLLAVPVFVVWWAPRQDVMHERRVPVSHAPLLTASLVPSHRAVAGRPSAASTAAPVYRITDLPGRKARASKER
jgi:hypothetical protein